MGRRKTDRWQYRLANALMALTLALSALASYLSYRAIRSLDDFDSFVIEASARARRRALKDF